MKLVIVTVVALSLSFPLVAAELATPTPRVGDVFEIRQEYQTEEKGEEGSSSSSTSGQTTVVERVVAVRSDGVELEYDLPADTKKEHRLRQWQLPAKLLRPFIGQPLLLNRSELESRLDAWLKAAKLPRTVCGSWYFTWNAFKVECDPQSAVTGLHQYNLWNIDLRDGAPYHVKGANGPAALKDATVGGSRAFVAEAAVDPEAWRRERAESDVVVAQIMGKPTTEEAALRARASESVSGTIKVVFEADPNGIIRRRTTEARLTFRDSEGKTGTQVRTERLERRLILQVAR